MAGVEEIYAVGGAQSVAALAYGTESIKKFSKYRTWQRIRCRGKRQVYGLVGIDLRGPSEIMVAQTERHSCRILGEGPTLTSLHDPDAGAVLVTTSRGQAETVAKIGRIDPNLT